MGRGRVDAAGVRSGPGTALGVTVSTRNNDSSKNSQENAAVSTTSPPATTLSPTVPLDGDTEAKLNSFMSSLPAYTQSSLEDPSSPQSRAYAWLSTHRDLDTLEDWRMKQLLALSTFFFAFNENN